GVGATGGTSGSGGSAGSAGSSGTGGSSDAGTDGSAGASGTGGTATGGTGGTATGGTGGTATGGTGGTATGGTGGTATGGTGGTATDAGSGKLLFVTSKTYPANFASSGNAATVGAAQCKQLADAVTQTAGKSWHAWLSTGLSDAITGITGVTGGWRRGDGALGFSSAADIVAGNAPQAAISLDETGATVTAAKVWTGTDKFGKKLTGQHCAAWSTLNTFGIVGLSSATTSKWTDDSIESCSGSARLYCFEK
ncbi:MAG TPA: hypothetical protein PKD61_08515, partial [Polyangiaceae bacterium]|nr:hypothetical protein [Polyangiaceae bacterium]